MQSMCHLANDLESARSPSEKSSCDVIKAVRAPASPAQPPDCSPRTHGAQPVAVTLVSDEETGGRWGSGYLIENYRNEVLGDCVLNGEPRALTPCASAKRRSTG